VQTIKDGEQILERSGRGLFQNNFTITEEDLRSAAAGGIPTSLSEFCHSTAFPVLISKYNPDVFIA
jgi:hypothetical protein